MKIMLAAGLVMLLAPPVLAGSRSATLCTIACNNDIVLLGTGPTGCPTPYLKNSAECVDGKQGGLVADKVWYKGKWVPRPSCDCRQFTTEATVRRRERERYLSQMQERAVIEQQREMYDQMYRAHGGDE